MARSNSLLRLFQFNRPKLDKASSIVVGQNQLAQWPEDNYEQYARAGYGRNEIAFACVNEIATSGAEARLRVMVGVGAERKEVDALKPDKIVAPSLATLIKYPNPRQSQYAFLNLWHT